MAPILSATPNPVTVTTRAGSTAGVQVVTIDNTGDGTITPVLGAVTGPGAAGIQVVRSSSAPWTLTITNTAVPATTAPISQAFAIAITSAGADPISVDGVRRILRRSTGGSQGVLRTGGITQGVAVHVSADPSIATVDPVTGLVAAVAPGEVIVTAYGPPNVDPKSRLVIVEGDVAGDSSLIPDSMTVSLAQSSRPVGGTTQATAVVRNADDEIIAGAVVAWTSSDTSVATVDGNGLVTAVAAGTATITATTSFQVTGSADITVTAATAALYTFDWDGALPGMTVSVEAPPSGPAFSFALDTTSPKVPTLLSRGLTLRDNAAYDALNVPDIPIGGSWLQENGVRCFKAMQGAGMTMDYPTSGVKFSLPDADGRRFLLGMRDSDVDARYCMVSFKFAPDGQSLIDMTPQVDFAAGNPYGAPGSETTLVVSKNPDTPHIAFWATYRTSPTRDIRVVRWHLPTNTEAPNEVFPAGGVLIPALRDVDGGFRPPGWLSICADETVFSVCQDADMWLYNTRGETPVLSNVGGPHTNEGYVTPDGNYAVTSNYPAGQPSTEYHMSFWDTATATKIRDVYDQAVIQVGHAGLAYPNRYVYSDTYWDSGEGNYDVVTDTRTVTPRAAQTSAEWFRPDYAVASWDQRGVPEADRSFMLEANPGLHMQAQPGAVWTQHDANTWYCTPRWAANTGLEGYQFYTGGASYGAFLGVNLGVWTGPESGVERVTDTVQPVTSLAALAAGPGVFRDASTDRMYVRLADGTSPAGKVQSFQRGGGAGQDVLAFVGWNGSGKRFFVHTYNVLAIKDPYYAYYDMNRASTSPDGLVAFGTSMNRHRVNGVGLAALVIAVPPRVAVEP